MKIYSYNTHFFHLPHAGKWKPKKKKNAGTWEKRNGARQGLDGGGDLNSFCIYFLSTYCVLSSISESCWGCTANETNTVTSFEEQRRV